MHLLSGNVETLLVSAVLTILAAVFTVLLSAVCGAAFAARARPTACYGAELAILFIPYAIGESVWAYSLTRLASWCGLQAELVASGTFTRAVALLFLSLARTLPLGAFFCATTLHRYTSEIRPYFQTHQLSLPFFLLCALNRIPKSILTLLGLFGGALMACESSLATFLYRANPGTEPETANIMLARLFREIYASVGSESLSRVATLGLIVSLLLLISALIGTWAGRGLLSLFRTFLGHANMQSGTSSSIFSFLLRAGMMLVLAPGIVAVLGLIVPARFAGFAQVDIVEQFFDYQKIILLGVLVSGSITVIGIATAVRLRYSRSDLLALLENKPMTACLLMLPAFIPILSVVAILGIISNGHMTGLPGYVSLFISHFALHYSVFQFICMSLIAGIPESHVAWQRTMKLRYSFSLMTDGFRRHFAVIISLIGLGIIQVVTDGSVSRWFSHLVKAPEEAFYAAVFGRLSSAAEAAIIAWTVAFMAIGICVALTAAHLRELRSRPRYV